MKVSELLNGTVWFIPGEIHIYVSNEKLLEVSGRVDLMVWNDDKSGHFLTSTAIEEKKSG